MSALEVPDDVKGLRETLCLAQASLQYVLVPGKAKDYHMAHLGHLIQEIDRHRPLGPDGKHGTRHTDTCGCEDR